uniref:Ubinuclein 1 n=1 Tax=Scleropages formosus TaxID=113540 RepID=A0A8C9R809_SCLFO
MAERRRIQLTTLSNNVPLALPAALLKQVPPKQQDSGVPAVGAAAANGGKSESTLRLVLALFEPDQRRCPEFYYPELVRKKNNAVKRPCKSLDEEENQGEMEAIAKKFEEKYGGSKRKKDRLQDLVDMGYGYDETDSFIDNSEAYDELVPASLTTKYGGFYINSGTLQFRQASESESDDFVTDDKKKIKKRKSKEEGDTKLMKKKKEDQHKKKPLKTGIMPLNASEEKKKKKKKHASAMSVNEMLKKFQNDKDSLLKEETKPPQNTQSAWLMTREMDAGLNVTDPLLSLIGSANENDLFQAASTIDFDIDLDKLLYDSPEPSPSGLDENSDPMATGQAQKQPLSFPDGLPPELEKRVKEMTQAAKGSDGEGKQKFFTQDINSMLLDIEIQSRELNSPLRSGIYAYLASFLPCSKDTLLKRAKKLHLHEQDGRLKEPLQKLKEAIGRSMPEQIAKYQDECLAHTQAKYAKMLEEGKEKEQKEKACSDEDEDEDKSGKRVMGPRKKFQWNDEIRDFLCSVVGLKVGSYELEKNKSQSPEEYLKAFLEAEVKPLWPKGWMQSRMLFKESRRVHSHITCLELAKVERKICSTLPPSESTTVLAGGPSGTLVTSSASSAPSATAPSSGTSAALHPSSMDDSLDGDLIHNPPSLGAVSEELAALNSDGKCGPDFTFSCKPPPETLAITLEDGKATQNPPCSTSSCLTPTQSPLNLLAEQALALGQIPQERKMDSAQLLVIPGYSDLLSQTSMSNQALTDSVQVKPKNCGLSKSSQSVLSSSLSSPALKPFLQHNQHQKCFPAPVSKASKYVAPCLGLQQPTSKSQTFLPLPCTLPNSMLPTSPSISKMAPSQGPAMSYQTKQQHNPTTGISSSSFQPIFSVVATTKSGASQSRVVQSVPGTLSSVTNVIASHKSPTPTQVSSLPSPNTAAKKTPSPQKLTLVAPPGGENGDSSNGTQGVARLLTSSLAPPKSVPAATVSQRTGSLFTFSFSESPALPSPPSLNLLSPSFTTAGQTLAPGTLGVLPGLVPMHAFSFPVLSFSPDSASKALGSTDAIVTGPAPGTFHHGLTRSKCVWLCIAANTLFFISFSVACLEEHTPAHSVAFCSHALFHSVNYSVPSPFSWFVAFVSFSLHAESPEKQVSQESRSNH